MSDTGTYARYFSAGTKVGVGIPLPNAEVFRDWAVIHELDEDLVSLQLSRDQLPARVILHVGQVLEIRGGKEDNAFSVRAIIVNEGYSKKLLLRLIGEIVSDELREFLRIDAFLPIKYYLSEQQNPEILEEQWKTRRQERFNDELVRKQKRWDRIHHEGEAGLPRERHQDPQEDDALEDSWDTIIPLAANISGGGVRIMTHQGFKNSEFVLLEILVPSPRHIVDVVARVAFANPNRAAGKDHEYFNTGLQFVFIDERDRDLIVNHISDVQLQRIRQLREMYLFRSTDSSGKLKAGTESITELFVGTVKNVIIWSVMAALVWALVSYFRNYATDRPKNEIEEVFENGVKKYREIQGK